MKMTATQLRQDIYNVLDRALETGEVVEVERKGKTLKIVPALGTGNLARLKRHDDIVGDLDDLVHIDWSKEWSELKKKRK